MLSSVKVYIKKGEMLTKWQVVCYFYVETEALR